MGSIAPSFVCGGSPSSRQRSSGREPARRIREAGGAKRAFGPRSPRIVDSAASSSSPTKSVCVPSCRQSSSSGPSRNGERRIHLRLRSWYSAAYQSVRPAGRSAQVLTFEEACGYASTSSVDRPTSAAPVPRARPCAAAIATRSPVKEPGPVATATRETPASVAPARARIRSIVGKSSSPWRRCACQVSSARTSRPSNSATDAQVVEVSSASNIAAYPFDERARARAGGLEDDPPLRLRDVLEPHVETVLRQLVPRAVRPLDDGHAAALERLLPPCRAEVRLREAVEVEMEHRHPAARVLVQDDEGRARDLVRVDAEACGDAACEDGLPRTELAPQRDHITRARGLPEALAEPLGVQRRVAHEIERSDIRPPRRARICGAHGRAG